MKKTKFRIDSQAGFSFLPFIDEVIVTKNIDSDTVEVVDIHDGITFTVNKKHLILA